MSSQEIITRNDPTGLVPGGTAPELNPARLYIAGLGARATNPARSRETMWQALETIAGILSNAQEEYRGRWIYKGDPDLITWGALRYEHTKMIKTILLETEASPASTKRKLAALRGTLKEAWRLGPMGAEEYQRAIDLDLKGVKGETLPAGRSISPGEIQGLLETCARDQSAAGARDAAIVAISYSCGLRRAELVGLDLADYDAEVGTLVIRGKGHKERLAYVVNGAAAALADWLTIRGDKPGPLFYPIRKGGHPVRDRMTTQAVYHILQARAREAGVSDLSPHDFRRTFVGDLLDAGADISTVQRLAGHANVTTTARYDRRPEAAKRKAIELLHVPYRRRTLAA